MTKPPDVPLADFAAEVIEWTETPVLVDFWSETCGHCLALSPQYDQAAEARDGEVKFVKVSFQECRELFSEHAVRATPTLILFRDGREHARRVGAVRADDLLAWIDESLGE